MSGALSAVPPGIRRRIVALGASLFDRSLTHGRTGNLSVRHDDSVVVTPSGVGLGALDPDDLSVVDLHGRHLDGPTPSKEAGLHAAVYRARPAGAHAVVHLHCTHAVAVSCLADTDPTDVLPPLTAYYAMRVGTLPMLPYHPPGDPALVPLVERSAAAHHAVLLANHGPVVAGSDLDAAADAVEELEETARLHLLLSGRTTAPLTREQADALAPTAHRPTRSRTA